MLYRIVKKCCKERRKTPSACVTAGRVSRMKAFISAAHILLGLQNTWARRTSPGQSEFRAEDQVNKISWGGGSSGWDLTGRVDLNLTVYPVEVHPSLLLRLPPWSSFPQVPLEPGSTGQPCYSTCPDHWTHGRGVSDTHTQTESPWATFGLLSN